MPRPRQGLPVNVNQAQRNFAAAMGGGMQAGPQGAHFRLTPQDYQQMAIQMQNAQSPEEIAKLMFKASAMTGNPDYARNAASMFNTQGTNQTNVQLGQMQSADSRYGVDARTRMAMQEMQHQRSEAQLNRRHQSSESALDRQARLLAEKKARKLERMRMRNQQGQWQQGFDREGLWRAEDIAYRDTLDAEGKRRFDEEMELRGRGVDLQGRGVDLQGRGVDLQEQELAEQRRANQAREEQSGLMGDHQIEMGQNADARAQRAADLEQDPFGGMMNDVEFDDDSLGGFTSWADQQEAAGGQPAERVIISGITQHPSYPEMRGLINDGEIDFIPKGWLDTLVSASDRMLQDGGVTDHRQRYNEFRRLHRLKHSPELANAYGAATGNAGFWEGRFSTPDYADYN